MSRIFSPLMAEEARFIPTYGVKNDDFWLPFLLEGGILLYLG
jgi:hypothetical protein